MAGNANDIDGIVRFLMVDSIPILLSVLQGECNAACSGRTLLATCTGLGKKSLASADVSLDLRQSSWIHVSPGAEERE